MALKKIISCTGHAVRITGSDIDTDRIIPARFMKCITFDGLGEYLFYDERFSEDGSQKHHPLNTEIGKKAKILLCGDNFGCGSSREHAPQALYRFGIRALIAQSFAEIFFGNCSTLGIPCVTLSPEKIDQISKILEENPTSIFQINVKEKKLIIDTKSNKHEYSVGLSDNVQSSLISGEWDSIVELLDANDKVDALANKLAYIK